MSLSKSDNPFPPPTCIDPDATGQDVQLLEATATAIGKDSISTENNANLLDIDKVAKPKDKSGPNPLIYYFRVLSYGTKGDRCMLALSCFAAIGSGTAMPLMNVVFGNLVGTFTNYFMDNGTVTKAEFMAEVNKLSLYFVYLFIGKFVLSYISLLAVRISGMRISAALRLAYLKAALAQPVSNMDTISPGKVSTRITTSSNTIQLAISQNLALFFQSLSFTIGLYVVSFVKSWLLTLVASACLPFILIVYGCLVPPFMKINKVTEAINEEASALAYEMFSSIRMIAAFGAEERLANQHRALIEKAANNGNRAAPLMGLMMAPSLFSMYATFALTFWFGIRQYTRGHIDDIGVIVVVLFSVMLAVFNVGQLVRPIIAIAKAATAATELFVTIDAEVPDRTGLKDPDVSADGNIQLSNVSFSYPSRPNVPILDELNIQFEAGKVTAIVGPSGSGKSTIVGLLQRWYDLLGTTALPPKHIHSGATATAAEDASEGNLKGSKGSSKKTKNKTDEDKAKEEKDFGPHTCIGSIRIDGTDIRKVDLKWWRSQIGLVQQEPFLFNDTVFNNVAFGLCGTPLQQLSKENKLRLVEEACREAFADEFILKLPLKYETLVGESGIKLSGGQRQRIAIARSIVKKPPILILDEATSAIDVRTERIVQEALDRVSKNRTTIVIAHRLSTIKRADKIVVLRRGRMVEEGAHEQLLKIEDGVYSGLVIAQKIAAGAEEEAEEETGIREIKTGEAESSYVFKEHDDLAVTEAPEYKDRGFLGSFGTLLLEQRHHWIMYSITTAGILAAGAIYPIQAYVFANIVEVFTLTGPQLVRQGNFWSAMFAVEAGGIFLAYFALGFASHLISVAIIRHYRQEYLVNMIGKHIPFFDAEGHAAGSLTSRLSTDTEQIQQLMSTEMSLGLIACVNLVGSIIISFVYGWKLSLVGLFCALPAILTAGYLRMSLEINLEKKNMEVFEDSSQFATEAVGAFRTVLSLIMEDTIEARYRSLLNGHVNHAFKSARSGTLIFAFSDSVELACMALTFWYGGTLLASREYGIQQFFVVYMAIVQGAIAAGQWFSFVPNMAQAAGAANRILSMRKSKDTVSPKYDSVAKPEGGVGIDFQNVSFTYKNRELPVLSNLNLRILPGQFAALVGASGCGKSTTISLLERFYDATSGQILYNDQNIASVDPSTYRQQISLVSQEPTLYEGTLRDNIALSVDSATDAQIHQACADAQIHEFITSLPDGYNTRLGPKGMSLSGGQKQRLSLARALLRKPKLLLLDEATSSLDSESEKLVQAAIERAVVDGGRTVLAVAHRLATIQNADVIFVMGSGKVLEKGDHQSLLRKRGLYYQMCQAQALDQ